MNLDARHMLYGHTLAEQIQTVSDELPVDAVGLWQIVPAGRYGFGLDNSDLAEFVRRCALALPEHGAKPVVAAVEQISPGYINRNMAKRTRKLRMR